MTERSIGTRPGLGPAIRLALTILGPITLGISACGNTIALPPVTELPIIEGLLLADSADAVVRVRFDLGDGLAPPPPAHAVRLTLREAGGPTAPFEPVSNSSGYYRATIPVVKGRRYILTGTAGATAIHAETVIPGGFDVIAPRDTVTPAPGQPARIPFEWAAAGARVFVVRGGRADAFGSVTRATRGELLVEAPGGASTTRLVVLALNPEADAFLFAEPPRSNVLGGVGYLGGAIAVTRTVRWP